MTAIIQRSTNDIRASANELSSYRHCCACPVRQQTAARKVSTSRSENATPDDGATSPVRQHPPITSVYARDHRALTSELTAAGFSDASDASSLPAALDEAHPWTCLTSTPPKLASQTCHKHSSQSPARDMPAKKRSVHHVVSSRAMTTGASGANGNDVWSFAVSTAGLRLRAWPAGESADDDEGCCDRSVLYNVFGGAYDRFPGKRTARGLGESRRARLRKAFGCGSAAGARWRTCTTSLVFRATCWLCICASFERRVICSVEDGTALVVTRREMGPAVMNGS